MSSNSVKIEELAVERLRGIQRPEDRIALELDDISDGVNLVYGPNGAGKTTVAIAIEGVLAPKAMSQQDAALRARVSVAGQDWDTDLYAGRYSCTKRGAQESGVNAPFPLPSELVQRYRLDLTGMLTTDDSDVAEHIRWELNGGYDVAGVKERLGLNEKAPPSQGIKEVKDLRAANERLRECQNRQKQLREKEKTLASLRSKEEEAAQSHKRAEALRTLLQYREALSEQEQTENALQEYAPQLAKVQKEHPERLNTIWNTLSELREKRAEEERNLEAASETMKATGLTEELAASAAVNRLQPPREQVGEAEDTISQCERELSGKREKESMCLERLDAVDITPEQAGRLNTLPQTDLFELARRAQDVASRKSAQQELRTILDSYPSPDPDYQAQLSRGIPCLRRWLQGAVFDVAFPLQKLRTAAWLLCGGAGVAAVILAVLHYPLWLLLAVPFAVMGVLSQQMTSKITEGGERAQRAREEYEQESKLPSLQWHKTSVQDTLHQLEQNYDRERLNEFIDNIRKHSLFPAEQKSQQEEKEVAEKQDQVQQEIGVALSCDDANFAAVMATVAEWQRLHADVRELEQQDETARQQLDKSLAELNAQLDTYGMAPVGCSNDAQAAIQTVRERIETYTKSKSEQERAQAVIEQHDSQIASQRQTLSDLLQFLELSDSEDSQCLYEHLQTLEDWLAQKESYEALLQQYRRAGDKVNEYKAALANDDHVEEGWYHQDMDDLKTQLQELQEQAEQFQNVRDERVAIENEIAQAKQRHDVEEALASRDEALHALEERREQAARILTGNKLIAYLQHCSRQQSSRLLPRAAQLFAELTEGRYELDVSEEHDGGAGGFLAKHTVKGSYHDLDNLSSGERIQLLLAARLAFLEEQEKQNGLPALPLICDEVLANSDANATDVTIRTVLNIAAHGRQVFYFTAQEDELSKWQQALQNTSVLVSTTNLAALRQRDRQGPSPVQETFIPQATPEPGAETYSEYGARVGVPRIDPRQDVEALHLWYVLDDSYTLCKFLRHNYVEWGQLKHAANEDADVFFRALGIQNGDSLLRVAQARANVWEAIFENWRVGRSEQVSRFFLDQSESITETFIDQVDALAEEVDRDARQLVDALFSGAVPKFRKQKAEQFAQELYDSGYIDDRTPYSVEELRTAALKAAAPFIEHDLLASEEVDTMLSRVAEL